MSNKEGVKEFFGDLRQHLMTGISFMLPMIIIFAFTMVLSNAPGPLQDLMTRMSEYSQMLIVPILATYIAYSISGKLAIPSALVVSLLADQMGMGFLGGVIVGLLAGYFVKLEILLIGKLRGGHTKDFVLSILVIPLLTPIVLGAVTYFLLANPISSLMIGLSDWLVTLSATNSILLAAVLGAMIGFDMGGPINKVAFAFILGAYTEGAYAVSGPVLVSIAVPTLGMALAAALAPRKYTKPERDAGKSAWIFGIIGLTEGAIPFATVDPLRVIPVSMFSAALSAALAALFGISNTMIAPSTIGLFTVNKPVLYVLCHIIGAVVMALLVNVLKKNVDVEEETAEA
jgi:fructose PTS system EIIBC or EIIC component